MQHPKLTVSDNTKTHALDWLSTQQAEMENVLVEWCNTNSGSYHVDGVNRVGEMIAAYISERLEVRTECHALSPIDTVSDIGDIEARPVGKLWRFFSNSPKDDDAVKVLLTGHLDTVFPSDSAFQTCTPLKEGVLGGPGVADMKGGILVMINALRAIERSELAPKVDWQILLNPDEEIGSHASASYLAQAATEADVGLVFEPSMPDGNLAGARKGSGNFSLIVTGKAAHAGREFDKGRNAISALSSALLELETINASAHNITLNLGAVHGGGPVNIVPDRAVCHFNTRVTSDEEASLAMQHIEAVVAALNERDGFTAQLVGGFTRPAKPATPAQEKLFSLITACGAVLDLDIGFKPTGGCCDGNNLAAAGLPNVDSLGVQGGNIHSHNEYIELASLTKRAQLSTLILSTLAKEKKQWLS